MKNRLLFLLVISTMLTHKHIEPMNNNTKIAIATTGFASVLSLAGATYWWWFKKPKTTVTIGQPEELAEENVNPQIQEGQVNLKASSSSNSQIESNNQDSKQAIENQNTSPSPNATRDHQDAQADITSGNPRFSDQDIKKIGNQIQAILHKNRVNHCHLLQQKRQSFTIWLTKR